MSLLLLNVTLRGVSNKHCLLSLFSLSLEFVLDEAKVKLSVSYIKGVPMPDEIKVTKHFLFEPVMRKPVFKVSDQVYTNRAVQPQKMARGLIFSGRKGISANQIHDYHVAGLHFVFA